MQSSSIPPKFPIPWANSAGSANVRSVPTASQISIQAGAASLTDGFPPLNFIPVSAGGVPPFGQDMNGILKQTTQWLQWQGAGGPIRYDSSFAATVGGYPAGALILSNSGHVVYQSLVDNNLNDPNATNTNWRIASSVWSATAWLASGSANAQTLTLSPVPTSLSQLSGIPIKILSQGVNTGAVTLNINNLGPVSIVAPGGIQLALSSLITGYPYEVILQGTSSFILTSRTNTFYDPSNAGLAIQGLSANGANLSLLGNGSTTPNKYIRAINGAFQITNSTYTTVPLNLTDSGDLTTLGSITSGSLLRATNGTTGVNDQNAAPILADFGATGTPSGWLFKIPALGFSSSNVIIVQGGLISVPANDTPTVFPFTTPFPANCLGMVISYGATTPPVLPQIGVVGAQPTNLSQFLATNTSTSGVSNGCYWMAVGF